MKKLLLPLACAAFVALAPATASGDEWTHEGLPVETTTEARFTGPAGFTLTAAPENGLHCSKIEITLDLFPSGGAEITHFFGIGCTATPSNLVADTTAIKPHDWEMTLEANNDRFRVDSVHINTKITLAGSVVSESTLKGTMTFAVDDAETIETASLSDDGMTINGVLADFGGSLKLENSDTDIGMIDN